MSEATFSIPRQSLVLHMATSFQTAALWGRTTSVEGTVPSVGNSRNWVSLLSSATKHSWRFTTALLDSPRWLTVDSGMPLFKSLDTVAPYGNEERSAEMAA